MKIQIVTLAVAILQSFAQVSHADLINDKLPKGNSDSHRRQKRENERQLQTKLIGDVRVLVKDPGFRGQDDDKQKSSTVWPTTLPPRILQNQFAIQSDLGPQIKPSRVLKTDYTTFTYFITSLLAPGVTTTSTDIIISSNVITENAPVSPTAPWEDLQSSRLGYNEIKIPSSLGYTSRTFYTKIPSGLQVTTKTYYTTSTLYSTYFQNGRTYTKTRTIVRSEILEDRPFSQAAALLVSGQEDDVKYLSLGSNIYGKIKTLFATYTYTTTNLLGEVGPSTRVITQYSTSVFSSSPVYKTSKVQLSPDELASVKLNYLQNQGGSSSGGNTVVESGLNNNNFGVDNGQVVEGGNYQVLGSGEYGQGGGISVETGASGQSGNGGSSISSQYGTGTTDQTGNGGSATSGQHGTGQSENGGNVTSGQYGTGATGQSVNGGSGSSSGQYGTSGSSQSNSSSQYGTTASSLSGNGGSSSSSGQYDTSDSSQSGNEGSGSSDQNGTGTTGQPENGGSVAPDQNGSGTLGQHGSSATNEGNGASSQSGYGESSSSDQYGTSSPGQSTNGGSGVSSHSGHGSTSGGGSTHNFNEGYYEGTVHEGIGSSTTDTSYNNEGNNGQGSSNNGHYEGTQGDSSSSNTHGGIYVEENDYEDSYSKKNKTENTQYSSAITTEPIKPSGVYLDSHYLSSLKSSFLNSASSSSESSTPIWDVDIPSGGPDIIRPPSAVDPPTITVTETLAVPSASVSPSGVSSESPSTSSSDSSTPYPPSEGGGGVINAVVGGIAEGLGGVFGGGNENVGLKVDLGPVLDAVATLLRGPIRSAIANRRSDVEEPGPTRDFNHIPRHTQVFVSELTTIPFAQRNIQARHNTFEFGGASEKEEHVRSEGIAPRSDDSPALHVPKEILDEINKHRTFKDEPVYLDKNKLIINDHVIHTNDPYIIDVLNKFEQGHLFGEYSNKPMAIKILSGEQINGYGNPVNGGNTIDQQEIQKILSEEQVRNNALNAKVQSQKPRVPPPPQKHGGKHPPRSVINGYRNPSHGPHPHQNGIPQFPGNNHRIAGQKARLQQQVPPQQGRAQGPSPHTNVHQHPLEPKNAFSQFNVENPKVNYNRQLHSKRNHGLKRPKFSDVYPGGPNEKGFSPNFRPHPQDPSQNPGVEQKTPPLFPHSKHAKDPPSGYHNPPLALQTQKNPPRPSRGSNLSGPPKRPNKQGSPQSLNNPPHGNIRRPSGSPNGFIHRPVRPRPPVKNSNLHIQQQHQKQPRLPDHHHIPKRLPRPRPTGYIRGGGRPSNVSPNADVIEENEEDIEFGFTPKVNNPFLRPGIVEDANLTRNDYNPNERVQVIQGSISPQIVDIIRPSSSSKNKLIATGYGVIVDGYNVRDMTITDSYGGIQVIQTKVQDAIYNIDQTGVPLRPPPKISKLDYQGWNTQHRESASVIRPTSSFSFESSLKKEAPKTVTYANEWSVYRPDQSSVIDFIPQKRPTLNTNFDREWTVRDTVLRPSKASAFSPPNTRGYNNEWSEVRPYIPSLQTSSYNPVVVPSEEEQSSLISHAYQGQSIASHQSFIHPTAPVQNSIESSTYSIPSQLNHQSNLKDSNSIINAHIIDNQNIKSKLESAENKRPSPKLTSQIQKASSPPTIEPSVDNDYSLYLTTKRSIAKEAQSFATQSPDESLNPVTEPDVGTFINIDPYTNTKSTAPLSENSLPSGSVFNVHPSASTPLTQGFSRYYGNFESNEDKFPHSPSKKIRFKDNSIDIPESETNVYTKEFVASVQNNIESSQSSNLQQKESGISVNLNPSSSSTERLKSSTTLNPNIEPDTGTFINIFPSSEQKEHTSSSSISPHIEPDTGTFINIFPSSSTTRVSISSTPRETATYSRRESISPSLRETLDSKLPPGIEPDTGTFINIFPSSTSKRAQATEYIGYVDSDTIRRGNENQNVEGFGVKIEPYDDKRVFENDYPSEGNVFFNSYNYDDDVQGSNSRNNIQLHGQNIGVTPQNPYQDPPALVIDLTGRPTFQNEHSNLHDDSPHTHPNTQNSGDSSPSGVAPKVVLENTDNDTFSQIKNQRRPVRKISQGSPQVPSNVLSNSNIDTQNQSPSGIDSLTSKGLSTNTLISQNTSWTRDEAEASPSKIDVPFNPIDNQFLVPQEPTTTSESPLEEQKGLDPSKEVDKFDGFNKEEIEDYEILQEKNELKDFNVYDIDIHFTTNFEVNKDTSTTPLSSVTQNKETSSETKFVLKSDLYIPETTIYPISFTTENVPTTNFAPTTIKTYQKKTLSVDLDASTPRTKSKEQNNVLGHEIVNKNTKSRPSKGSVFEKLPQIEFENIPPYHPETNEFKYFDKVKDPIQENHGSVYLKDPIEENHGSVYLKDPIETGGNNSPYRPSFEYDYGAVIKEPQNQSTDRKIKYGPSRNPNTYYDQYDWIPTDGINIPGEPQIGNPDHIDERNDKNFYDLVDYDGDANNFNKIVVEGKDVTKQQGSSNNILKELLRDAEDNQNGFRPEEQLAALGKDSLPSFQAPQTTNQTNEDVQGESSLDVSVNDPIRRSFQGETSTTTFSSVEHSADSFSKSNNLHESLGGDGVQGHNDTLHAIDLNGSVGNKEHSNKSISTDPVLEIPTDSSSLSSSTESNGLLPGIPSYDGSEYEYGEEFGDFYDTIEDPSSNAGNVLNLKKIESPTPSFDETQKKEENHRNLESGGPKDYADVITGQSLTNTADIRYVGSDSFRGGETSGSNEGNIALATIINGDFNGSVDNDSPNFPAQNVSSSSDQINSGGDIHSDESTDTGDLHDNLGNVIILNGSKKIAQESSTLAPTLEASSSPSSFSVNDQKEALVIIGPQKPQFEPSAIDTQRKPLVVYGPQENPNKIRKTTRSPSLIGGNSNNFIGPLRYNPNFIGPFKFPENAQVGIPPPPKGFKFPENAQVGIPPPPEGFEFVGPVVHGPVRFNPKRPEDIIQKTQFNANPEVITGIPAPSTSTTRSSTTVRTKSSTAFASTSAPTTFSTTSSTTFESQSSAIFTKTSKGPLNNFSVTRLEEINDDGGRKSDSRFKVNIKPTHRPIIDLFNRRRSSTTERTLSSIASTNPIGISFNSKFSPKYSVIQRSTTPSLQIITSSDIPSKKVAGFFIPRSDGSKSKIEKVYPNKESAELAFEGDSNTITQTDAPGIIRDQTLTNIDGAIVESIPGHSLTAEETDPETRCQNACGENEICQVKSDKGVICKCRPGFGRVQGSSVKCGKSKSFEIEVITTSESEEITIVKLSPKEVEKAVADSYRKNIKDLYFGSQITSIKVGNNTKRNVFFGGEKNLTRDDEMSINMIVHIADNGQNSSEEVLKSVLETPIKDTKLPLGADVTVSRVTIEDFDECAHKDYNDCSEQAVCHNIKGSYTCICKDGYHDLSGPEILSGRVCLASTTACDLCNGNGNCIAGEVVSCECQPWFAGKNCQINMKLLLIVGCVSVGLMLVIACGVSCFCCKDGRSAALRSKQSSIPSPYGTGIAPMPPMRGHGILMDPHGTMKSRAFVPKPYAIRPKRSKKSTSSAGGSSYNGSTSAAGGAWQTAAVYSGMSGADSTTSKQSRKSGGALSSGIEALNPGVLIPRAKVKPKLFEDFLSEDEASSSPEANRALSEHTSLASRHRRRSIPFIIRSSRSERGGSVDPLLDASFSDDSASRTLRGNTTLRSVASETFEVPVLHSNNRITSGSVSVRSSRSHATSDGGRIMAERDGGSSFVISASRSHQLYRLHGSDGSLDSL